jgi:hypothetical protein
MYPSQLGADLNATRHADLIAAADRARLARLARRARAARRTEHGGAAAALVRRGWLRTATQLTQI